MKKLLIAATLLVFPLTFVACTAKVYVMDRHTIMEDEAAGEWPEFEKDILAKTKGEGPTAFQTVEDSEKKKRLYNVLNGEMTDAKAH